MKRFLFNTILPAFLLLGATSMVACSGDKLPSSDYEKVKFAFNGVEKTFRNPKTAKRSLSPNKKQRLGGTNPESGLSAIFNLFTDEDIRDDFLDVIEYNQPPMIQFQYLKKVFEKVGSGYEFGTKYYETVTGDVMVDIETGYESEKETDKFNYALGLGMDININEENLITADVSFDIKLTRNQEEYNTKWYVCMELDYDMENSSPNYTMTMVTENNETELPYYGHYTYEYDYVEVKNSQINEWRKFCMDNSSRLVKDAAHPNFDSYTGEGSKYRVDACTWYKNGTYYKKQNVRESGDNYAKTVGEALYSNLGLNATEINADAFFAKASTPNSVLKACYQEFGKVAKKDVIYSLVCSEGKGPQGGDQDQDQAKTGIRAMKGDLSGEPIDLHINGSTSVGEIFNGFFDAEGQKTLVSLYYIDKNSALLDPITDLNSLHFFFGVKNKPNTVEFYSLAETLESAYGRLYENGQISEADLSHECAIFFVDKDNANINGIMNFYYSSDLPGTYQKPEWPNALKTLGVPEYDGEKVTFNYSSNDGRHYLGISSSTYEEGEAYCRKLRQNDFAESSDYAIQENEHLFKKAVSEQYNLYVNFRYGKSLDNFLITAWQEEAQQGGGQGGEQEPPEQPYHIYLIGDCNNWGKNGTTEFIASYEDSSWTFTLENFHANANESFAFVTNLREPESSAFNMGTLVDDPRGLFDIDYDRSNYAFKATQEFTATFTVGGDGGLHVSFDTQNQVLYLTIVGSFNGWNPTEGAIEMEKKNGGFEKLVSFDANVEFKIMQNHSWDVSYGYSDIKAFQSADMRGRFSTIGEFDNIYMLQALTFTISATINDEGQPIFSIKVVQ